MRQVLKALIPVVLIGGLIFGIMRVFKAREDKARAEREAAAEAKRNEAALAERMAITNTIEEVYRRAEAQRLATNISPAPQFAFRPDFHVSKTNVTETVNYLMRLAEELQASEKVRQNNLIGDDTVRLAAEARAEKELVPEVVRVLKEAGDVLPVTRAIELRQRIVPLVTPKIGGLINKGVASAPAPDQPAVGITVSPVTHTPEQVSAYLLRVHDNLTNANAQYRSMSLNTTGEKVRQIVALQKQAVADIDRTIREIPKSPWTRPQLLAFRGFVSEGSGEINHSRLLSGLPQEQVEVVTRGFSSVNRVGGPASGTRWTLREQTMELSRSGGKSTL